MRAIIMVSRDDLLRFATLGHFSRADPYSRHVHQLTSMGGYPRSSHLNGINKSNSTHQKDRVPTVQALIAPRKAPEQRKRGRQQRRP